MSDETPRIFEKKVGDDILTREVHTASDAVAANFDGYFESKKSKAAAEKAAPKPSN